jgi:hypothetical protein
LVLVVSAALGLTLLELLETVAFFQASHRLEVVAAVYIQTPLDKTAALAAAVVLVVALMLVVALGRQTKDLLAAALALIPLGREVAAAVLGRVELLAATQAALLAMVAMGLYLPFLVLP